MRPALSDEVAVQIVHHLGKHIRRVEVLRRGSVFGRQQKYLVHADVKRLGLESIRELVDQSEHNLVRLGIHRIPFAAVDSFVVGKRAGRQIQLRILREQWPRFFAHD